MGKAMTALHIFWQPRLPAIYFNDGALCFFQRRPEEGAALIEIRWDRIKVFCG